MIKMDSRFNMSNLNSTGGKMDVCTQLNMQHYPICLDIKDKNCLVVGGGAVGARKVLTLVKAGGQVTVVSTDFSKTFFEKTFHCRIKKMTRPYESSDIETMFIVIAATDNMQVNRQIAEDARNCGILCNIADYPEGSSFILPSIVHQGDLLITVSTSGSSPALARKLRKDLEQQFGDEYARFLILMGRIRNMILSRQNAHSQHSHDQDAHSQHSPDKDVHSQYSPDKDVHSQHSSDQHAAVFRRLVNSDLLNKIALNDASGIEEILDEILGSTFTPNLTILYKDLIFTSTLSSEER